MKYIKRILIIIGIILTAYTFFINIVFNSSVADNLSEKVSIDFIPIVIYVLIAFVIIGIYSLNELGELSLEKINENKKAKYIKNSLIVFMYVFIQLIWIIKRMSYPVDDSNKVYICASQMFTKRYLNNLSYFELYPQNLSLAYLFSKIFTTVQSNSTYVIKCFNIIANCFSILAIYKITDILKERYNVNNVLKGILCFTYIPIILLVNFVYGDIISIPFVLFSLYFIMKYNKKKKIYNFVLSSILIMISVMLRMNNLIIAIAIAIYLLINFVEDIKKENSKKNIIKLVIVISFCIISVVPSTILKNCLAKRYVLDLENKFPTLGFIAIGITEGTRACGWYNDAVANIKLKGYKVNAESIKSTYKGIIKKRLQEFAKNPMYMFKFYNKKEISIWAEPLQESIWQNLSFNFDKDYMAENDDATLLEYNYVDEELINNRNEILIHQKALIIIIFGSSTIFLIKNFKNISNEIILLLLCFMGGFAFHTIWEAKSRYIILYIIVLIPIASLKIDLLKRKVENKDEKDISNNTNVL